MRINLETTMMVLVTLRQELVSTLKFFQHEIGNMERNVGALSARMDRKESTLARKCGFQNLKSFTLRRTVRDDDLMLLLGLQMTCPKTFKRVINIIAFKVDEGFELGVVEMEEETRGL